ncbi:hypothetical protein ORY89_06380 [Listeria monocytogenes]|uniref:hypothetical protein n=1 Tax=Listeria TaxID=1637 RepID=UPI001905852A|nr:MULTISPECIES: hypothetical protein [Listeria]MBK1965123.1 hypothetical protein [Listeria ivanovii subsp. londoniensis]WDE53464.1 hypothetical protein ORY89_06380 [Listeria monocytogenes]HEM1440059.1 hypothetical protein [Listeria monocytogenes]
MRKVWTDEEVRLLRNNYEYIATERIAIFLNRTAISVKSKAIRLGLSKNYDWSEDDDIYLEYFVFENDTNINEAAEFLNRTHNAVRTRIVNLRKKDSSVAYIRKPWTEKEDDFLKNNYKAMSDKVLAERLQRTKGAVTGRKRLLGLKKIYKVTSSQDKKIRSLGSAGHTITEIADAVQVPRRVIYSYVHNHRIDFKREISNQTHIWRSN